MLESLTDRLRSGPPVLLDGATGTELARRGVNLNHPSWTAGVLLDDPSVLSAVHRDYVAAGAEIITADTFRTHARSLRALGREGDAGKLTRVAVDLARAASAGRAWVAGSVAPLEDCYSPQLTPAESSLLPEHQRMAEHLAAAGVELILIETQVTIREAACAARAAAETGIPFAVSFVAGGGGRLLSGESLREAFAAVALHRPVALLVNCTPCAEVLPALTTASEAAPAIPRGAYANTGKLAADGTWAMTEGRDPAVYAEYARAWKQAGLRLIGGCCGTTPAHLAAVREMLYVDG